MIGRVQIIVVAVLLLHSCTRNQAPTRLVGASVESATTQLGIHPTMWQAAEMPGYEVSCVLDQAVALYGEHATVCVVRRGGIVAALDFRVDGCTGSRYDELRKAVIAEFGLSGTSDRDVYVVRRSGVVHLRPTTDDGAELVVTDSTYGNLYVKEQLRKGFVDLSNGLRPH